MSAIVGGISCLGESVSRRWTCGLSVAVFASSASDETMPSKDAIREVQQQARAGLGAMVSGAFSFTTPVGRATKDNEDLFRVGLDGRDVLWIPPGTSKENADAHGMRSHEER